MSALLNLRLARSLWRTKIRLIAVILMVFVGVFAGVTFGGYAHNLEGMYATMQADNEQGANLADLWIDNKSAVWTAQEIDAFCSSLNQRITTSSLGFALDSCEGRMAVRGAFFHADEAGDSIINSLWYGIPVDANADRVWMPEGYSEGRLAQGDEEIVVDAHVTKALNLHLGDLMSITAGNSSFNYTIVGIAYHPLHVMMTPEGSLFPPEAGQYVVGYLSDSGIARLTGNDIGSANLIALDIQGTPSFDLPDTQVNEGQDLEVFKTQVVTSLEEIGLEGKVRDRGQNDAVEFLRQDLEGAKRSTVPFTVMIAIIAAITIVLSLQRLVQSQAKEIAVLRTLGIKKKSLMTGYLIAPLVIGAIGCLLGALAGPWGMNWMLDFYESLIGVPIPARTLPLSVYSTVILPTMMVVFVSGSLPAWKASRLDPLQVLSGKNQMRVGSGVLQKLTHWMPTTIGLSLRSSVRKPIRLAMTFLAVGISLMLFGSVQMMGAGIEETIIGGLEEQQTWDAQVFILPDGEHEVISWAFDHGARYELLIEMPIASVHDQDDVERVFNLVAFDSFTSGMRSVTIIEGHSPNQGHTPIEVMLDEGAMAFLDWHLGDVHTIQVNGVDLQILIVGKTQGELSRTMYFTRTDLSEHLGVNATSVYLDLPEGEHIDTNLGEISAGIIERQTLVDGIKKLIGQQTQIFDAMMVLGLMFTVAVMFNTMIMNVAERDVELATLRVLGASTGKLSAMLLFESLLIGIVGGFVGVLFAYAGAVGIASSFSSWQFYISIVMVPSVAIELMLGVIIIAVLMTPIGVGRLRKMDLVQKVKDLSQ